jgi:hypothetical protein
MRYRLLGFTLLTAAAAGVVVAADAPAKTGPRPAKSETARAEKTRPVEPPHSVQFPYQTLAESTTLFARAATLEELIAKAKPTLVYNKREFIWVEYVDEKGGRTSVKKAGVLRTMVFTHATAYMAKFPGDVWEWVIVRGSADGVSDTCWTRARLAAPLAGDFWTGLANHPVIAPRGSAGQASRLDMHETFGDLYCLSYDRASQYEGGEPAEERIFLLEGKDGTWRHLATLEGTGTDFSPEGEGDYRRDRTLSTTFAWGKAAEAPLTLTCVVTEAVRNNGRQRVYLETFTLGGGVPLKRETARHHILVQQGDTLSGIAAELAHSVAYDDRAAALRVELDKKLLELNPGAAAGLTAGDHLRIPNPRTLVPKD